MGQRLDQPSFTDLDLVAATDGTRLRLRVKPGARASAIVGVHGGALKVSVAAPPERGKANAAVVALLADVLGLPASSIEILSGETSQDKVVRVGLDPKVVRTRLERGR